MPTTAYATDLFIWVNEDEERDAVTTNKFNEYSSNFNTNGTNSTREAILGSVLYTQQNDAEPRISVFFSGGLLQKLMRGQTHDPTSQATPLLFAEVKGVTMTLGVRNPANQDNPNNVRDQICLLVGSADGKGRYLFAENTQAKVFQPAEPGQAANTFLASQASSKTEAEFRQSRDAFVGGGDTGSTAGRGFNLLRSHPLQKLVFKIGNADLYSLLFQATAPSAPASGEHIEFHLIIRTDDDIQPTEVYRSYLNIVAKGLEAQTGNEILWLGKAWPLAKYKHGTTLVE